MELLLLLPCLPALMVAIKLYLQSKADAKLIEAYRKNREANENLIRALTAQNNNQNNLIKEQEGYIKSLKEGVDLRDQLIEQLENNPILARAQS